MIPSAVPIPAFPLVDRPEDFDGPCSAERVETAVEVGVLLEDERLPEDERLLEDGLLLEDGRLLEE